MNQSTLKKITILVITIINNNTKIIVMLICLFELGLIDFNCHPNPDPILRIHKFENDCNDFTTFYESNSFQEHYTKIVIIVTTSIITYYCYAYLFICTVANGFQFAYESQFPDLDL